MQDLARFNHAFPKAFTSCLSLYHRDRHQGETEAQRQHSEIVRCYSDNRLVTSLYISRYRVFTLVYRRSPVYCDTKTNGTTDMPLCHAYVPVTLTVGLVCDVPVGEHLYHSGACTLYSSSTQWQRAGRRVIVFHVFCRS